MAEDTGWKVYRKEWYNDRTIETYISAPIVDKQNDLIPTAVINDSMDFFMKYGVYSYQHEEMPIGLPLAYKIKDGKIKIRVGIHSRLPMHDKVWKEIKDYGKRGASSIRGETIEQDLVCPDNAASCFNKINELGLWSVSWVGDNPANIGAGVTDVSLAKGEADNGESFINSTRQSTVMPGVKKDCDCKAAEADSEEKADEVIAPEDLPDVPETAEPEEEEPEEEEKDDHEEEELTLEHLAEEMKAMKQALAQLYEEKQEDDEDEPEEVEASDDKAEAETDPSFEDAMKTLKKYGVGVYAGRKRTPAPKRNIPAVAAIDYLNVTASWDEIEAAAGGK